MKPLARNLLIASLGILAVVSGWRIVAHSRADAALDRGDVEAALAVLPTHPDALAARAEHQRLDDESRRARPAFRLQRI